MKTFKVILFSLLIAAMTGCATHQSLGTSQFRDSELNIHKIALDKNGLSRDQISVIASTKPPQQFPVDVAIIFKIEEGVDFYGRPLDTNLNSENINLLTFNLVAELKKSKKINRVTVLPSFLVPSSLSFNSIQELGVRSLSEYIIVFFIDKSDLFRWTAIFATKYEALSQIDYLVVDSFTAAILASDRLFSRQTYNVNPFSKNEERKALEEIFSEQGNILGNNIAALFGDNSVNSKK